MASGTLGTVVDRDAYGAPHLVKPGAFLSIYRTLLSAP